MISGSMTVGLNWYGMLVSPIQPKRTTRMMPTITDTGFSMENLMGFILKSNCLFISQPLNSFKHNEHPRF